MSPPTSAAVHSTGGRDIIATVSESVQAQTQTTQTQNDQSQSQNQNQQEQQTTSIVGK